VVIDGIELKLVKVRNVPCPRSDHFLRKTESGEACDVSSGDGAPMIRERSPICRPWCQHRPCEFPIERSPHRGMLFSAYSAGGVNDPARHIIKKPQYTDAACFGNFLRSLQCFEQVKREKSVTEPRILPRLFCGTRGRQNNPAVPADLVQFPFNRLDIA